MTTNDDLARALCDKAGIDQTKVTHITITIKPRQPPRVFFEQVVTDGLGLSIVDVADYELVRKDPR